MLARMPDDQDEIKLEEREEEEVYQKSAASARVVYKAVEIEGEEELERSTSALAWSGVAAGLSMGFSLVCEGLLRSHLPDRPWRILITKLGYSVGFLIVVLGRQQLFTENTLTPMLPLLHHPTRRTLMNVARLWITVLVCNLLATAAFAYVVALSPTFDANVKDAFLAIGLEAIGHPPGTLFLRAIFAGWLIALMVWLLPVAEQARVLVIIIITYLVGLAQLSHIIAGSVEAIYVVAAGRASWEQYVFDYMLPTLLGNILGGVALVAALNHAQVIGGGDHNKAALR
jgi:formate/nitrite transporter FocA (FNT family)